MRNITILTLTTLLAVTSVAAPASKAAVVVPADLGPGESYHLVFVTRDGRDALSLSINDYNDFVQAQAALNPALTGTNMGVTYKAIASTWSVNARDNASVEAPVYLLDGTTRIADEFADLWDGTIQAPIAKDQFAATADAFPWTGTEPDGTAFFSLGNDFPLQGDGTRSNSAWIRYETAAAIFEAPLYALSQKLTVPTDAAIPEPSSVAIWLCLGGIVGLASRWGAVSRKSSC